MRDRYEVRCENETGSMEYATFRIGEHARDYARRMSLEDKNRWSVIDNKPGAKDKTVFYVFGQEVTL